MLKKSLNVVDVSSRLIVVNVVNNVEAQNRRFSAKISLRRLTAAKFSPRRHSLYNVYAMRCEIIAHTFIVEFQSMGSAVSR